MKLATKRTRKPEHRSSPYAKPHRPTVGRAKPEPAAGNGDWLRTIMDSFAAEAAVYVSHPCPECHDTLGQGETTCETCNAERIRWNQPDKQTRNAMARLRQNPPIEWKL